MSKSVNFDIIGGYAKSEFPEFNPKELVNMYVNFSEDGKRGKAAFPTPGTQKKITISSDAAGRSLYFFKDDIFAVVKDAIYRIDSTFNSILLGSISTETGHIGISDNGVQVIFVDGVGGWLYDSATLGFNPITDPGFPSSPQSVVVLGGRFLVNFGGTGKIGYSDINDGSSWPALNFFSMEPYPDIVVGMATLNGRLFVMGQKSTITYYESENADLPFRKDAPAFEFGASSIGSIYEGLGFLVWFSRTDNGVGSILMTTGGNPISISTQAIDFELQSYNDVSDATSFIYKNEAGNTFYVINFTTANKSWMFQLTANGSLDDRWSQLEYKSSDRAIANAHTYFMGRHYVLSYLDGGLYDYSNDYYDDDGVNIRRSLVTKNMFVENMDQFRMNELQVDLKQGTGLADNSNEDNDPVIFLSVSRNGGISYGNSLEETIGKIGQRNWKTRFFRLGYFNKGVVIKLEHYNKTPVLILGASANVEKMA